MSNERTTIYIPETIDEAMASLGGIERLLTAKGWERAAIVYAFTGAPGRGGPPERKQNIERSFALTCDEFAALRIAGLRSDVTVREYRRAWSGAIDKGWAQQVKPGDMAELPDEDYPRADRAYGQDLISLGKSMPVERQVAEVRRVIKEHPEIGERIERDFIEKAAHDPGLASRVERAYEEYHPAPIEKKRPNVFSEMAVFGLGSTIYADVKYQRNTLDSLLDYIREHSPLSEPDQKALESMMSSIENARRLLVSYEDEIRQAMGVNYDDVFNRLMNS